MKKDFILDFETIGQNIHQLPAIDVSYATFDWDRFCNQPYSFHELVNQVVVKRKLSIEDQVKTHGCSYKESDLQWWMEQPKEVRSNIKPTQNDLTLEVFFTDLINYLQRQGEISHWWSRANTFDPVILDRLAWKVGKNFALDEYLKYWAVRDTRTWIDAKFNFPKKNGFVPISDEEYWNNNFKAHDSAHDVAADILRLQAIHRAENDMEQVEK